MPIVLPLWMALLPWRPQAAPKPMPASLTRTSFGALPGGGTADLYTLTNGALRVRITNYGATVVSIEAPGRDGKTADIALGFDTLAEYLAATYYYGATVGRYANRIAGGRFTLDGKIFTLPINNGPNTLHGGLKGFDKALWTASDASTSAAPALQLSYVSRDGEEGFPGRLAVTTRYTLAAGGLRIEFTASTDRDTVVNLTNHTYFNLKGRGRGDTLDHQLTLHAARFTPVDANLIPTGELRAVAGTPFDFNRAAAIGARIAAADPQLAIGHGYDHNYALDHPSLDQPAAEVYEPASGRVLRVFTTQPGLQFYSGNYLATPHAGFALEAQHYPDSPNHPAFPPTELKPGAVYHETTVFAFSVR